MPLKIAFGSQARVGKDTACNYLQDKYSGTIYHFSDPLYQILHYAQDVCGFPRGKDAKFLQYIGTEWGRNNNPNVWLNVFQNNYDATQNGFLSDLRFPNEADLLKSMEFTLIRIIRDDRPMDRDPNHPSETSLLDYQGWDYVIKNNGTVEELYQQLDDIVRIEVSNREEVLF